MRRLLLGIKALLLSAAFFATTEGQSQVAYTLQVLHASDLEGGVEAIDRAKYFAAIVDTLEGEYANTVILSAGDNYIPGPFFNAAADRATFRDGGVFNRLYNTLFGTTAYNGLREEGGRADITLMNIIGFDASCIGNHEFDAGADAFENIIEEDFRSPVGPASDRWVGAQFPYLSANLDFSASSDLANLFNDSIQPNTDYLTGPTESQSGNFNFPKIAAATYINEGGEKIGVIGATTPRLALISSPGDVAVKNPGAGTNDMQQLASILQPVIDSVIAEGSNKIILVTHMQQFQLEETLIGFLSGVDVIIAGGSDAILANNGDRLNAGDTPLRPYPVFLPNADGDTAALVSTDGEYSYVGRLVLGFDANGKVVPSSVSPAVSGPYVADSMMVDNLWGANDAFADPASKGNLVDSIASAVSGVVTAKDGNIFGTTDVFLNGQRTSVRTEETNFGNLTADANLWQAQQYDPQVQVSIKNGGGIRAAIGEVIEVVPGVFKTFPPQTNPLSGKQEGEISQLDIENSLRFNNGLSVMELTADGLRQVIEHGVSAWAVGATPGQFCQVGGLEFSFDPALAGGSRIVDMMIVDSAGNPVDTIVMGGNLVGNANRVIKIVTLDFLAGGGDGYPYPTLGANRIDLDTVSTLPAGQATFQTAGTEQDALAEFLSAFYLTTPYDEPDVPSHQDIRIQNLSITPPNYTLQILHASDLEGGVEAIDRAKYFAAIVDNLEEQYDNSITLSAGDNYIPGPFFNAAADRATFRDGGVFNNVYNRHFGVSSFNGLREEGGRADITIMNLIGFDASCIGNHEFDAGADPFENIIEEDFRSPAGPASDRWVGAQFPYLSANLDFSASSDLGNLFTSNILENTDFETGPDESMTGSSSFFKIAASTYIDEGGEEIGIVGATTPRLALISSPGDVAVKGPGAGTNDMQQLASILQPVIDSLQINRGINKIVLVTHMQQFQLEEQLIGFLSGVDVIIAGGSDAILANSNDRLASGDVPLRPYPVLLPNADGDMAALVSTDGEYSYVGRLVVEFDSLGKLIPSSIDSTISGPYIADSMMTANIWQGNNAFADPNGKGALVDSIASAVSGVVIAKDGNTFGLTDVYLNGQRSFVRTEETNFGSMTADANLYQAIQYDPTVQVSLKNGGGIRAAIGEVTEVAPGVFDFLPPQENPLSGKQEGEISQLDIENSLRFNNGLSVMELTADGLKQVVEHAIATWAPGATPGQFCQVSGIEFSFDPAQASGSRIQSMVIIDTMGNVVDTIVQAGNLFGNANRVIKIVTLDFLAGGGDGYPYPTLGSNRVDLDTVSTLPAGLATFQTAGTEQDALAEYLLAFYASTPYDEEDTDAEEDERIQILSIRPDDIFGVGVTFANARMSVDENAGQINIQVDYDNATANKQAIDFNVMAYSTADGSDYSIASLVDTAQANTAGSFNLSVTITDDNVSEQDEILFLEVTPSLEYFVDPSDDAYYLLFIKDNENVGPTATNAIELRPLASYGGITSGSTEILDYDPMSQRLFVTNADNDRFEILDFSDPTNISKIDSIDISMFGAINSLSVHNGVIACAIEGPNTMSQGVVAFYDTNGVALSNVTVGVLPDMVTFTHNGNKVVVACEGEPNDDYDMDPEGSIAIIDVSGGAANVSQTDVTLLDFNAYDSQISQLRASGVRIFGPNATVSQDLEPEYVTISEDNNTAYVACQEANAVVIVDLAADTIVTIAPLGWKDHSLPGNGLDSDRGINEIHIANAPFRGLYQPDAIASYEVNGVNYIVSANEGDSRDYDGYSEEDRLDDLELNEDSLPDQEALFAAYGDIKVTLADGDLDGDGIYEHIYTYGARSFSIWNGTTGALVYDSGDDFEQIVSNHPEYFRLFNTSGSSLSIKNRSDDKGPEPEAVVVADIRGTDYAFIGLERTGGVMVYDVSNPASPVFVDLDIPRDTATGGGDLGPEGLIFIPRAESPNVKDLLVAANEVSTTITVWEVFDTTITSINEIQKGAQLLVFPNPSNSQVFVTAEDADINIVELYDVQGRMILNERVNNSKVHILNVEPLSPNVYVLRVYTDKGMSTTKLIVE